MTKLRVTELFPGKWYLTYNDVVLFASDDEHEVNTEYLLTVLALIEYEQ